MSASENDLIMQWFHELNNKQNDQQHLFFFDGKLFYFKIEFMSIGILLCVLFSNSTSKFSKFPEINVESLGGDHTMETNWFE